MTTERKRKKEFRVYITKFGARLKRAAKSDWIIEYQPVNKRIVHRCDTGLAGKILIFFALNLQKTGESITTKEKRCDNWI